MSIKAKAVEKDRAAAFDRGHFVDVAAASAVGAATTATTSAPKRSYYYEGERRYEAREAAAASNSSSASSSRSSSRGTAEAQTKGTTAHPRNRSVSNSEDEMSDDEEVVRRARAATRALLEGSSPAPRPASAQARPGASGVESASLSNDRLEAYLRGRAGSVPKANVSGGGAASLRSAPSVLYSNYVGSSAPPAQNRNKNDAANIKAPHKTLHSSLNGTEKPATGNVGASTQRAQAEATVVSDALKLRTTNSEFQQLMTLFERDVRHEQQRQQEQSSGTASTPGFKTSKAADVLSAPPILAPPASQQAQASPPPRAFAALEDDALETLFADWCRRSGSPRSSPVGDDEAESEEDAAVFIAADHRAAAFTLAAVAARGLDASSFGRKTEFSGTVPSARPSSSAGAATAVMNAPLTWEELMQGEVARRNARCVARGGGSALGLLSSPSDVAERAAQQLRRFLQSVACIEELVNSRRFMRSVAMYLYEHHKVFLPHYTPSPAPSPLLSTTEGVASPSAVVEHRHEEYAVYEEFGERVSSTLLSLLTSRVDGFDEAEFIEALYDTPAAFAEEDMPAADRAAAAPDVRGPQNVLSFPAWRLVLAMSDFESFFAWMMDYVYEEYHLDRLEEDEKASVAGTGARGLRALIRSTYKRPAESAVSEAPLLSAPPAAAAAAAAAGAAAEIDGRVASPPVGVLPNSPPLMRLAKTPSPPPSAGPRVASASTSSPFLDSPLQLKTALAPLPASAALHPAPPPPPPPSSSARAALSASLNSSSGGLGQLHTSSSTGSIPGVHLRQFFPTPPASAEGGARASGVGSAMTGGHGGVYRKRQTVNPSRNLPPITPSTDIMVRSGSAGVAAEDSSTDPTLAEPTKDLSASVSTPAPLAPGGEARPFASTAPPRKTAAPAVTATAAAAPANRLNRTRSSTGKNGAGGVEASPPATRRGSKTQKPKSRTSSTTRPKVADGAKPKPQKPKLSR